MSDISTVARMVDAGNYPFAECAHCQRKMAVSVQLAMMGELLVTCSCCTNPLPAADLEFLTVKAAAALGWTFSEASTTRRH